MKNRLPFWISLLLTVTFYLTPPAEALAPQSLTFPAVAPVAETNLSLPFTLPGSPASAVSFHCAALVELATGNRISGDRLTFTYGQTTVGPGQLLTLASNSTERTEPGSARDFWLHIKFLPSDPPGEYEGIIEAVLHPSTEKTEGIPLRVKVRVLPWIKLETAPAQPLAILGSPFSFTESSLEFSEPLKLLLASNAPWRLYLKVGMAIPPQDPGFPLRIGIGRTGKTVENKNTLLANGPAQLVASGPPTVVGDGLEPANYWTELYFSASITDWRQYPTGNHQLTFYFSGQTIAP